MPGLPLDYKKKFTINGINWTINSSQVQIKYEFSKPFRSKPFSKDGNHAESEQFLWPFNYIQNNYKKYSLEHFVLILIILLFYISPLCPSSLEHVTV